MMSGGWIGLVVMLVILYVIMDLTGEKNRHSSQSEALEKLAERYAKGEINEEEYEQIKQLLKK